MADNNTLKNEILRLKKEKNALILAHYYVPLEVQDVADEVGDSFKLAKSAKAADADVIVLCGVRFMGESAKILSPDKTVLLPAEDASCPMADMITADGVKKLRAEHPDASVVCYVNSSAEVKALSDICCTSASADKVAAAVPGREIIFVPDRNLGGYIAERTPDKDFLLYDGCCPIHDALRAENVLALKAAHPDAALAVHPECRKDVTAMADYIGSTSGIIEFAENTDAGEIIIGTENEIVRLLSRRLPDKKFYAADENFNCTDMKKITLEKVRDCLKYGRYEVTLPEDVSSAARTCLERMVAL